MKPHRFHPDTDIMRSDIMRSLSRVPPVLVLTLLAACSRQDAAAPPAPRLVDAQTVKLSAGMGSDLTLVPGLVASSNEVQVASRLSGYIRSIDVREGQSVQQGALLLEVDPSEVQGQLDQQRAALAQAQAGLANARADAQRFDSLYRDGAVARQQWEQVGLRAQVAQQQVAAAQAGFDSAAAQMRYAAVRAPIAGVVAQKLANPGDLAAPGRTLLVIEGLGRLQVQTQVPDATYAQVHSGDAVPVFAGANTLQGRVAEVVPVADPLSHTHLVKVDLPANAGLDSGSFVRVGFAAGSSPQLRLPQQAVVERAGMTGVFVVDAAGIAHFRLVRLGAQAGAQVDVQAGVSAGETVVTSHLDAVENGVKVQGAEHG
jgi:RND family efflux transporter MFP subunit